MMAETEEEVKTFYDLPDTIQLQILGYITNIREKIRLASVSRQFYSIVAEACRTQAYKLVNLGDFMYESEIRKGAEHSETIFVNLHKLLRIAPKLTHFVDKVTHFDYEVHVDHDRMQCREQLPLNYSKYLSIDLSQFYFFGRPYENYFDEKLPLFLNKTNSDSLVTLDIRTDKDFEPRSARFARLKALRLSYYATDRFPRLCPVPPFMLRLVDNRAPNLEEFEFTSHFIDIYQNLPGIMSTFAIFSTKMRYIKVTQHSHFRGAREFSEDILNDTYFEVPYVDDQVLFNMEYLDLRGAVFPLKFWEKLLKMVPNLKYLVCNSSTDPNITRLVFKYCGQAKYNLERPADIEDEYRHYSQSTHGSDNERYLFGVQNQVIPDF